MSIISIFTALPGVCSLQSTKSFPWRRIQILCAQITYIQFVALLKKNSFQIFQKYVTVRVVARGGGVLGPSDVLVSVQQLALQNSAFMNYYYNYTDIKGV